MLAATAGLGAVVHCSMLLCAAGCTAPFLVFVRYKLCTTTQSLYLLENRLVRLLSCHLVAPSALLICSEIWYAHPLYCNEPAKANFQDVAISRWMRIGSPQLLGEEPLAPLPGLRRCGILHPTHAAEFSGMPARPAEHHRCPVVCNTPLGTSRGVGDALYEPFYYCLQRPDQGRPCKSDMANAPHDP